MPMNPLMAASARRQWPLLGAAGILVVLLLLHVLLFVPTTKRYARAVQAVGGMQAVIDPAQEPAPMPPRVFAMVSENALDENAANERGQSGELGVAMIEDLSGIANRLGLAVTLSEPGPVTPTPKMVEVRVHLRTRGSYYEIVSFLHALEISNRIYGVDRYAITDAGNASLQLEIWVSRLVLKQPEGTR
jgi:hypothetical protein